MAEVIIEELDCTDRLNIIIVENNFSWPYHALRILFTGLFISQPAVFDELYIISLISYGTECSIWNQIKSVIPDA